MTSNIGTEPSAAALILAAAPDFDGESIETRSIYSAPGEVLAAIIGLQGELEAIKKQATGQDGNRQYHYADLAAIVAQIRPIMAKYGLGFMQPFRTEGRRVFVRTILLHATGRYEEEPVSWEVPDGGIKSLGSYVTYLRRYALSATLGIVTEEDSDGATDADFRNARRRQNPEQIRKPEIVPVDSPNGAGLLSSPSVDPLEFGEIIRTITAFKESVGERFYYAILRNIGKAEHANKLKVEDARRVWQYLQGCQSIIDAREVLGHDEWIRILGVYGYTKPQEIVSLEEFRTIIQAMNAAAKVSR